LITRSPNRKTQMNIEQLYKIFKSNPSVQTDSRKLKNGDIFFALHGPSFNGNEFALKALDAGAAYAVVDEDIAPGNEKVIVVNNALETLQALAAYHRNQFSIPIIAVTGSNGKTTTKELLNAVLATYFITYTTEGNLNNHIGVPLTILKIKENAEMAIIEMGANHLQEIESYCKYARPTHGLITNIGKAHLEGFGSAQNVAIGKGELFRFLQLHDGTAFVNTDDQNVILQSQGIRQQVKYGINTGTGKIVESDPFLKVEITGEKEVIHTNLVGSYNLPNVLAAVTVGKYFNIEFDKIKNAIESYQPSNSRSQMVKKGTNTIIMDAYNANPGSMKAAVENFAAMKGNKKILILGAMKELGTDTTKEHAELLSLISKYDWEHVILAGDEFYALQHPFHHFKNSEEAREWLQKNHPDDSLILVKGSRSMQMEKVVEAI